MWKGNWILNMIFCGYILVYEKRFFIERKKKIYDLLFLLLNVCGLVIKLKVVIVIGGELKL